MTEAGPYVLEREYTVSFHPETAPAHVAFAAITAGGEAAGASRPRRVLELGCGQGFGTALLAAANPDVRFEGYDFDLAHVAHAHRLIGDAGLENVEIEALSFAELAARDGLRDVDVAIVHGVLSWVEPSVQAEILAILAGRLVAGGMALVSYNCLPGWAPLDPLRELAQALEASGPEVDVERWLACLARLDAADAAYFALTPLVRRQIAALRTADPSYLAHEYFGTAARALAVRDVHERFARRGFAYAGSATIVESMDHLSVLPTMRPLLDETPPGPLRETLRDFGANRSFRRDLFRFGDGADPACSAPRFALLVPPAEAMRPVAGPYGEIAVRSETHAALVAVLAEAPSSAATLACRLANTSHERIEEALALLVHAQRVAPIVCEPAEPGPSRRFNAVIIERAAQGRFYGHLASPVVRTGVRVDPFELLALGAERHGFSGDAVATADFVRRAYWLGGVSAAATAGDGQIRDDLALFEAGAKRILAALL